MQVKNSLAKKENGTPTFAQYVKNSKVVSNIYKTLGSEMRGKKFVTSIISAVNSNPELQTCDFATTVSAGLIGESLNLSPSPQLGHYYMVPFNDRKNNRRVSTFQLGLIL
jgi:recombination protein RecT|nr:MAG TPA: recombinase, phage RecT family [Caudoviricetes sp.]